jgi:adenine deaminase
VFFKAGSAVLMDDDIVDAVDSIIAIKGGLAVAGHDQKGELPLPAAGGIMSDDDAFFAAADQYSFLDLRAKKYGSPLRARFIALSFMALLVILEVQLSDKGLFDGADFQFVEVDVSVV